MRGPNLGEFSLNMPTHSCAHVALTVSTTHTHILPEGYSSSVGMHAPAPVEVAVGYTNCSVWQPQWFGLLKWHLRGFQCSIPQFPGVVLHSQNT